MDHCHFKVIAGNKPKKDKLRKSSFFAKTVCLIHTKEDQSAAEGKRANL